MRLRLFFTTILHIFPLPSHSSRIFFRNITNDAKKDRNRWNICDRRDSVIRSKRSALKALKMNENPFKLETSNKTRNRAKLTKILVCSYSNPENYGSTQKTGLRKNSFETQGPSVLKVRVRQCRATVHYTISQDMLFSCFNNKPLVSMNYTIRCIKYCLLKICCSAVNFIYS